MGKVKVISGQIAAGDDLPIAPKGLQNLKLWNLSAAEAATIDVNGQTVTIFPYSQIGVLEFSVIIGSTYNDITLTAAGDGALNYLLIG